MIFQCKLFSIKIYLLGDIFSFSLNATTKINTIVIGSHTIEIFQIHKIFDRSYYRLLHKWESDICFSNSKCVETSEIPRDKLTTNLETELKDDDAKPEESLLVNRYRCLWEPSWQLFAWPGSSRRFAGFSSEIKDK